MTSPDPRFVSVLRSVLALDLVPDPALARMAVHLERLVDSEGKLNLTAIRDPQVMAWQHFADSLAPVHAEPALASVKSAADIGPGGGFPILPLAALLPGCSWIGIESVAKKARFIEETAAAMGLTNVAIRSERAEDAARSDLRGTLDLVTARAVGPVASLLEVALPLLRPGGRLLLFKTESAREEWDQAKPVLTLLGAQPLPEYVYHLPDDRQNRVLFRAEQIAGVPEKYPRAAGVPFKKPLG